MWVVVTDCIQSNCADGILACMQRFWICQGQHFRQLLFFHRAALIVLSPEQVMFSSMI
jgi:hypothetical protein